MLLVSFLAGGQPRIGALYDHDIVDFSTAAPDLPPDILAFIAMGDQGLVIAQAGIKSGKGRLPIHSVRLLAPIPKPARNIFCIGKNYRDHAKEVSSTTADEVIPNIPIVFTKATTSVAGPNDVIHASLDPTASVDYEGELGVIIGTGGRGITRDNVMRHVYGYTIINDVTSRRLQKQHQQWFIGKSIDGFCPMGPAILTVDEVSDPAKFTIQTFVNDEQRQHGSTSDMIFDIPCLIEILSRTITLQTGDIIATGTPAGVGMAFNPPRFLQAGDTVAVKINGIGVLENRIV
jgi:2-keto-4-pentenoate hydratase/2-oxohepta-3-ene-1,7-dioic acid hydratase in catechol pathway